MKKLFLRYNAGKSPRISLGKLKLPYHRRQLVQYGVCLWSLIEKPSEGGVIEKGTQKYCEEKKERKKKKKIMKMSSRSLETIIQSRKLELKKKPLYLY